MTRDEFDLWLMRAEKGDRCVYCALPSPCEAGYLSMRKATGEVRRRAWECGPNQMLVTSENGRARKAGNELRGRGFVSLVQRRRPDGGTDMIAERL